VGGKGIAVQLFSALVLLAGLLATEKNYAQSNADSVVSAADLPNRYVHVLKGKTVGVVANQSARVGNTMLVDYLLSQGIQVVRVFSPEHGFGGKAEAGQHLADSTYPGTNLPLISLYGKKKMPSADDLQGIQWLVFDMQDVGVRFYTYLSTLYHVLQSAALHKTNVMILDRPNPNGFYVDGPVLADTTLRSFVGVIPIPVVHGCTLGELGLMIKGQGWIKHAEHLELTVVPCRGYYHSVLWTPSLPPSPNLRNQRSILLYPTLCLFEGTPLSVGRGTNHPFEAIGHPSYLGLSFRFEPGPGPSLHAGKTCQGWDFRAVPIDTLYRHPRLRLDWIAEAYARFPEKERFFSGFFNKLAGNRTLQEQLERGASEQEIRASWAPELDAYKRIRKQYLLYPD